MFLESKKTDGIRKNIKIYHTGLSKKKVECIALASTVADSSDAKNNPKANINKNVLPNILGNEDVKI